MSAPDRDRPDPDALLAQIRDEQAQAERGKLRVYFGASAGVGKTYAMLTAARKRQQEGLRVSVGVVETHGRSETAALLDGLEQLPLKDIDYKGNRLREFDLDAAIAQRPDLILVDGNPLEDISNIRKVSRVVTNGRMYDSAKLWQSVGFHP